tara:strand:- start:1030 stop:1539 length:510 start_codon:yes stop_codon:yes gene_type:complete
LLNLFKLFKKKAQKTITLPNDIDNSEKIARSIFSPVNVTKSGELKNNVFRSPPIIDEVSVNRLDYTNATFLKKLSKQIENPSQKRSYFGFAILKAFEIREHNNADIIYSPISEPIKNPFHADIKIGYIKKKGEELPAEISFELKKMTERSRFYIDPDVNSEEWLGNELI